MKLEYLSDSREVLIPRSVRRLENNRFMEPALLSELPSIRGLALLNQSGVQKRVNHVQS